MQRGRLSPAEYVELLTVRGFKTLRLQRGWMAECPLHDDHTPSLYITAGDRTELMLHCFGCGAKFCDLLAAVGACLPERKTSSRQESCQYLRIRSSGRDHSGDTCLPFASATRELRVGIDPTGCRSAVEEERFWAGELMVKLPPRAGKVMRLVLENLVLQANERLASGWRTTPIAFGTVQGAKELGTRPSAITKALRSLEKHGAIERVGRLPMLGVENAGAWTWRLVVTPAVDINDRREEVMPMRSTSERIEV
jgi:hypothetical protein